MTELMTEQVQLLKERRNVIPWNPNAVEFLEKCYFDLDDYEAMKKHLNFTLSHAVINHPNSWYGVSIERPHEYSFDTVIGLLTEVACERGRDDIVCLLLGCDVELGSMVMEGNKFAKYMAKTILEIFEEKILLRSSFVKVLDTVFEHDLRDKIIPIMDFKTMLKGTRSTDVHKALEKWINQGIENYAHTVKERESEDYETYPNIVKQKIREGIANHEKMCELKKLLRT